MKKSFLRISALLISLGILLSSSIGCQEKKAAEVEINDPLASIIKANTHNVDITFLIPGWKSTAARKNVIEKIQAKTKNSLNITINVESQQRYSSDPFDINHVYDALIVYGDFSGMVEQNHAMDITELFPKYAPSYFTRLSKEELSQVTFQGRIMGIPAHTNASQRLCAVVREDLLALTGISEIDNLEDYGRFMETVRQKDSTIMYPGMLPTSTTLFAQKYGYVILPGALAYKWDDPAMKIIPWEETEAYKDALQTTVNWIKNDYLYTSNSFFLEDPSKLIQEINAGRLASLVWHWDSAQSLIRGIKTDYKFKVFPLYKDKVVPKTPASPAAIILKNNAPYPERIIKFIEWAHASQENYDLLMYGIKGSDYELTGNLVDLNFNSSGRIYYGWTGNEAFADDNYNRYFTGDPPGFDTLCEDISSLNTNYPPAAAFKPVYDNETRQVIYWREHQADFPDFMSINSYKNIDEVIKDIMHWNKLKHIDKLVQTTQMQLDKWREQQN